MLVERLLEPTPLLYKPALQNIKTFIKTSTSSMTAVPKPLKFLRPHYAGLEKALRIVARRREQGSSDPLPRRGANTL